VLEDTREYHEERTLPIDGRPIKECRDNGDWGNYDLIPHYRAADPEPHIVPWEVFDNPHKYEGDDRTRWKSSIFMPRWASRLTLIVTGVKVERLQDISEEDAKAEGIFARSDIGDDQAHDVWTWERDGWRYSDGWRYPTPRKAFSDLWDSIHGEKAWEANPFVAAISFRVIKSNIDSVKELEAAA
jgi:hypothetical protein